MSSRRKFLRNSTFAALGSGLVSKSCTTPAKAVAKPGAHPLVVSTWDFGIAANEAAWKVLSSGGRALDAVEQGVWVPEADASNQSVGLGGMPDRDGRITLDACIMDEQGRAGSVCALEHILHPVSVARAVMEKTPHVMIVGEGALEFALSQGFKKTDLMTPQTKKAWEDWKVKSEYKPVINIENHDTIGMLAIDSKGDVSGACTTSGLAFKMRGRVGDSPIIGAGLYVDNEVGGATCTGLGEAVLRTLGSFLVVELMRQGASPKEAAKEAVMRIVKNYKNYRDIQVGFIGVTKAGEVGAFALQKGFSYALYQHGENKVYTSDSYL